MAYDATKTWKKLTGLLHEVTASSMVRLVGVRTGLGGKLDVHEEFPRYRVAIAAGFDVTENDIVAVLAHEAGHIMQHEERLPTKTEADVTRRGMEFARRWGVLDEYLDVHERFHEGVD